METKFCTKCGLEKDVSEFLLRENGKYRNECKICHNEYQRNRYLEKLGKHKRTARKDFRESDPKQCIKCGQVKPLTEFTFHNRDKGQHRNFCHDCEKDWIRKYHKSPQGKDARKEWVENNKEKIEEYIKLYKKYPIFKENMRRYSRKNTLKQFGLTQEDYDKILQSQNGHCAICGNGTNGNKKNFCVDHDHETGKVRGLLCHNCNVSVGLMKESPLLLRKAAEYLESFKN